MKTTTINKIYFGIIVGLCLLLWFKSCKQTEPELIEVEVPSVTNTLPTATDTVIVYKEFYKTIIKETQDPEMSALVDLVEKKMKYFRSLSDSISKENEYLKAIEPRGFKTSFNDDFLSLELNGVVSGEIHEITPTYTIKTQKVAVPVINKNKFFYGGQIGQNKEFNNVLFEATLGLQNKKNNIILLGYDTENRFKFGYLHKF